MSGSGIKATFSDRSPEETLMLNLGHEILNFRSDFPKVRLENTFFLSPYGSAMFGLIPKDGTVYLGIPKRFYERFSEARWLYAAKVENEPGLFLIMQLGRGASIQPIALRIFIRSRRLESLTSELTQIRAVPMSKEGITRQDDLIQGFNLKFVVTNKFDWEIKKGVLEDF